MPLLFLHYSHARLPENKVMKSTWASLNKLGLESTKASLRIESKWDIHPTNHEGCGIRCENVGYCDDHVWKCGILWFSIYFGPQLRHSHSPQGPGKQLNSSSLRCVYMAESIPIWHIWPMKNIWLADIISDWWLSHPSEKYEFVSWDDDFPNIWKM